MLRLPLILSPLLLLSGCAPARAPAVEVDEPRLTVMTYNINFGLAGDDTALDVIREIDADVVLLQEVTPDWESSLQDLDDTWPHLVFRSRQAAGGLAALSKFPLNELDFVESPIGWFPAQRLEVTGPLGRVQILQVHLKPPVSDNGSFVSGYFTTPKQRLSEIETFTKTLDEQVPTLVVGDFNEKSSKATRHLTAGGMTDVLPLFDRKARTWRWKTRVGEISGTLDHIFARGLTARDARVVKAGRSDHYPVVAVFAAD